MKPKNVKSPLVIVHLIACILQLVVCILFAFRYNEQYQEFVELDVLNNYDYLLITSSSLITVATALMVLVIIIVKLEKIQLAVIMNFCLCILILYKFFYNVDFYV